MHRAVVASTTAVLRRRLAVAVAAGPSAAQQAVVRRAFSVAERGPAAGPGLAAQFPRGTAAGTRERSQDAWRARRLIVEAGHDHRRLLAVLGEQDMDGMDPHNAAIAVTRLAQAAQAGAGEGGPAAVAEGIAGDERFQRLVAALHAGEARLLAAMPPQQLAAVVEGLAVFGVKLPGL